MTSKQPFADCAHDSILAIKICSGTRPDINELEAPKYYIDLMKRCWDSNPDNRPNAIEIEELIGLFYESSTHLSKIDDAYSISVEVSDFTKGLIESE
ncbi:unnamed protein product [Rhizophagus irregularis]|nr:unnamed protein product [Rhizophagus irregularis]